MATPNYKNILVVRTDRIGDVVLTIPAIRALKKNYPASRITVWATAGTRDLLDGLPFIDQVLVERTRGLWDSWQFIKELRRQNFDLAVIYHTKQHTNIICLLAGIPLRLGYKNNKLGYLLTLPVEDRRYLGEKHEVEYCLDLLQKIGVHDNDLKLELPVQKDAACWADRFFAENCQGRGPLVLIHPDATCPTRRWPPAMFAEVAGLLIAQGAQVCVIGAPSAKPLAAEMRRLMKAPFLDLTGVTSLGQLVALLRKANLMISNDSGPAHVAGATGTPLVTIFFRNQPGLGPKRWRPLGDKSVLLMNKSGEEIVLDKDSNIISGRLDSTSCQDVLVAARKLLNR